MWGYFEEKLVIPLCRHAGTAWIWTEAFETVRQSQSFFYLRKEFEDMTPLEMQRTLVSAYEVEQAFLRPRKRLVPLVRNTPGSASPIHCMSSLLDRFILTTHYNGTFNLWALSRDASSMPKCNPKEAGVLLFTVSADKSTLYLTSRYGERKFVSVAPIHTCLNFVMQNSGIHCALGLGTTTSPPGHRMHRGPYVRSVVSLTLTQSRTCFHCTDVRPLLAF